MAPISSIRPSTDMQKREELPEGTTVLIVQVFGVAIGSGALLAPFYSCYPVATTLTGVLILGCCCYLMHLLVKIRDLQEQHIK